MLSVIIPVFNEGDALRKNLSEILLSFERQKLQFSILLADDGSKDGTWEIIESFSKRDARIRGLRLSRNFGKEAAVSAGLREAVGDLLLVMDSDLQHPPEAVSDMLRLMEQTGADIIDGVKRGGEEDIGFFRRTAAGGFYRFFHWATGVDLRCSSDFKLMKSEVRDALLEFREGRIFFRGLVSSVGFRRVEFPFEVMPRTVGTSRFSTRKLFRMAFDAILSYTAKPIWFTMALSAVFFLFALILSVQTLVNFFTGRAVSGFTTVILLVLILGSALTFSLGIIGMYIARIYDEVKNRPAYIVAHKTSHEKENGSL